MTATTSAPSTGTTRIREIRDVRRFQRITAAVILLVPAPAAAVSRLFTTDDSNARAALDLVATDPDRQFMLTLLGVLTLMTIIPAFLAAARLARRRRPVLTMIALGVNLTAYLSGWVMPALDTMYLAGSRLPVAQRDGAAAPIEAMWSEALVGDQPGDRGSRADPWLDPDGSGPSGHHPHRRLGGDDPVPAGAHPGLRHGCA